MPPRCARCGDVIGVYERVVCVEDGRARATSRAAEPGGCRAEGTYLHRGCYQSRLVEPVD